MHKLVKQSTVLLIALSLVLIPLGSQVLAQAEVGEPNPSAGSMTYDLFVMRPLSLPFTAISKTTPTASEKLVKDPFHFTMTRPLGTW